MIRKPPGAEQESRTHAAVGRAMEVGGEVKEAAQRSQQLLSKGCLIYLAIAMAFGLLLSDTPLWFKALLLMLGYGGYRLIKTASRRF